MKLYTESDLLKAIRETRYYSDLIKPDNVILKELTPLELPSDEEIEKVAEKTLSVNLIGFITGAKWMKEQILNNK